MARAVVCVCVCELAKCLSLTHTGTILLSEEEDLKSFDFSNFAATDFRLSVCFDILPFDFSQHFVCCAFQIKGEP